MSGNISDLKYLVEPAPIALVSTAVLVVLLSAYRAFGHEKETESKNGPSEQASITLDASQATFVPIASSISLILMFYLFSAISQVVTLFCAVVSTTSLFFCLSPCASLFLPQKMLDGIPSKLLARSNRIQAVQAILCAVFVLAWLISGHWMLNNALGIALCVTFVCHVRLPNLRICSILLICLFAYDIFWVFFSEYVFGANVMVTVATQQANNPMHTVANQFHMSSSVVKKIDLPVKIIIPRNLFSSFFTSPRDFLMLGLGDMALPSMLVALLVSFDHRRLKDLDLPSFTKRTIERSTKYVWFAITGYTFGLVAALTAGLLSHSPQPAMLYLVPCMLGPVGLIAWWRGELTDLWNGPKLQCSDE